VKLAVQLPSLFTFETVATPSLSDTTDILSNSLASVGVYENVICGLASHIIIFTLFSLGLPIV
jgi:hypothetical protein